METHLNNERLAELLAEPDIHDSHLASCESCSGELRNLRRAVQSLRADTAQGTMQTEEFWQMQRAQIRTRIAAASSPNRFPVFAWASAVTVALLAGLLLSSNTRPAPKAEALSDPDHELLVEVERVMRSDSVSALQPASLLVEEINRNSDSQSHTANKERRHED